MKSLLIQKEFSESKKRVASFIATQAIYKELYGYYRPLKSFRNGD